MELVSEWVSYWQALPMIGLGSDKNEKREKKKKIPKRWYTIELIVWPEQGNHGDWREQDDQGEVSIIIFGMRKSSGFKKSQIGYHSACL